MTGAKGRSGRRKEEGQYYRINGIRYRPSVHPPAFEAFLSALQDAGEAERARILLDIFLNGQGGNEAESDTLADQAEDDEIASAIDDFFNDF